jgi:hypothetical protein
MEEAFTRLGGIDRLITWAQELDDKGNNSNYKEFIKLYVKLVPPIKPEIDKNKDTQEGFIMGLIKAENILKLEEGTPKQLIDVDVETQ